MNKHLDYIERYREQFNNCAFVLEFDNKDYIQYDDMSCHYNLRERCYEDDESNECATPLRLHSSLYYNRTMVDAEDHKRFVEFLFDPKESPWKASLKEAEVHYDDEGIPYAFTLHDLNVPGQVMAGLCIASRLPKEFPERMNMFSLLLKEGHKPQLAVWLANTFLFNDLADSMESGVYLNQTDWHGPFPQEGIDLPRILRAEPDWQKDKIFTETQEYAPVHSVWRGDWTIEEAEIAEFGDPDHEDNHNSPFRRVLDRVFGEHRYNYNLNDVLAYLKHKGYYDG